MSAEREPPLQKKNEEYYEVVKEWMFDGKRRRLVRTKNSPVGTSEEHIVEEVEEEISDVPGHPPGAWQKVPGSENDLGKSHT